MVFCKIILNFIFFIVGLALMIFFSLPRCCKIGILDCPFLGIALNFFIAFHLFYNRAQAPVSSTDHPISPPIAQ